MKDMLLFPVKGMYNFAVKSHEDFHIHDEIALVVKLEIIFLSLIILFKPLFVIALLLGNLLNIPLILYVGGKAPLENTVKKLKELKLDKISKKMDGDKVVFSNGESDLEETIVKSGTPFFNENNSVLDKLSSIGRLKVLEGLVVVLKKKGNIFINALEKILKEEEIEYLEVDEETGEVIENEENNSDNISKEEDTEVESGKEIDIENISEEARTNESSVKENPMNAIMNRRIKESDDSDDEEGLGLF